MLQTYTHVCWLETFGSFAIYFHTTTIIIRIYNTKQNAKTNSRDYFISRSTVLVTKEQAMKFAYCIFFLSLKV